MRTGLSLLTLFFASVSWSATPVTDGPWLKVQGACIDGETWTLGRSLSSSVDKNWRALFESPPKSIDDALARFRAAFGVWQNTKEPDLKLAAEYWIWRSAYSLKLPHVAYRGFVSMLNRPVASDRWRAVSDAAIGCLNRVHSDFPALAVSAAEEKAVLAYRGLMTEQAAAWVSSIALKRLSRDEKSDLRPFLDLLRQSPPHWGWVEGLRLAHTGGDAREAEARLQIALQSGGSSPSIQSRAEQIRLTLARLHYELGERERALGEFRKFKPGSPEHAAALEGEAWTHLVAGRYGEAVGTAYSLQVMGMGRAFRPEAPLITVLAFFENCRYAEALQGVQFIRKQYQRDFKWLRQIMGNVAQHDFRSWAIQYEKFRDRIPRKVAGEWLRSSLLVAAQDELAYWDSFPGHIETLKEEIAGGPDRGKGKASVYLLTLLAGLRKDIPAARGDLIKRVNAELAQVSGELLKQLLGIQETLAAVEADTMMAMSERVLARKLGAPDRGPASRVEPGPTPSARKPVPVMEWESKEPFPVGEEEELWEDEFGFFRSDLSNQCPPK